MMAAENDDAEQRRAREATENGNALSPQLSHQLPASATGAAGFGAEGGGFDFGASERTNSGLTATDSASSAMTVLALDPSPFAQPAPGGSVDVSTTFASIPYK